MKAVESFTLDQVSQAQTKGRNWHISVLMERSSVGCPLPWEGVMAKRIYGIDEFSCAAELGDLSVSL